MTRRAVWGPFLAAILLSLPMACSETKPPTSPEIRLSDDRLYLPVPEVRRTVDLGSTSTDAVAAQTGDSGESQPRSRRARPHGRPGPPGAQPALDLGGRGLLLVPQRRA